jgi:hypothetical protein
MPRVIVTSLSHEAKEARLVELFHELEGDCLAGIEAVIVLTVVETAPGVVEERLRSVFDIVANEESIAILERWCIEARQLLQLHKNVPGGRA